jgi:hypothetical protein
VGFDVWSFAIWKSSLFRVCLCRPMIGVPCTYPQKITGAQNVRGPRSPHRWHEEFWSLQELLVAMLVKTVF